MINKRVRTISFFGLDRTRVGVTHLFRLDRWKMGLETTEVVFDLQTRTRASRSGV